MSSRQETLSNEIPNIEKFENYLANDDIEFPSVTPFQAAFIDFWEGCLKWPIWLMLAYQDIKLRYRRSVLGPFWITISMAITVYSMGFLYSKLFHMELDRYYPFLVGGMLTWSLISTIIIEMTDGLLTSEGFIKQVKLPYTLYIHRITARNLLIFFHNMLVMIPVFILFHHHAKITLNSLLLFPALFIIYANSILYGMLLGMIGARFRDISQMIKSLVTVIFFVTPVMWAPDLLSSRHYYLIDLNPFYAFIEIVRAPLLGNLPTFNNLLVVTMVTLFGLVSCFSIFKRYRSRIVYWL